MDISKLISDLRTEESQNNSFLHLTANEARLSKTARGFLNTQFAERYYMGAGDADGANRHECVHSQGTTGNA